MFCVFLTSFTCFPCCILCKTLFSSVPILPEVAAKKKDGDVPHGRARRRRRRDSLCCCSARNRGAPLRHVALTALRAINVSWRNSRRT